MLKFKERDELEAIFKSWHSSIPFDIEKLRDQRLRYHFKDRYDQRPNMVDWDYFTKIKNIASIIHTVHYKRFRLQGICFENRFEKYLCPNRTLGSYIEGKQKKTYDSILVRGFWGDIINSPYFSHGVEVSRAREKEQFYKKAFEEHKHDSVQIMEWQVYLYLNKLETLNEIDYIFEDSKKKEEGRKDKKEETKKEETKKEEVKKEEQKKETKDISKKEESAKAEKELGASDKKDIELLVGLANMNVKFIFLTLTIEQMMQKAQFKGLFNKMVCGLRGADCIKDKAFTYILQKNCTAYIEKPSTIIIIEKEGNEKFNTEVSQFALKASLIKKECQFPHYLKYNYEGPQ